MDVGVSYPDIFFELFPTYDGNNVIRDKVILDYRCYGWQIAGSMGNGIQTLCCCFIGVIEWDMGMWDVWNCKGNVGVVRETWGIYL